MNYKRKALMVVHQFNGNDLTEKKLPRLMYHVNESGNFISATFSLVSPLCKNETIGIITVSIYPDGNFIHNLSISEKFRRRQYGNALLNMCEFFLLLCGRKEADISANGWCRDWYKRHGYLHIGYSDDMEILKKSIGSYKDK